VRYEKFPCLGRLVRATENCHEMQPDIASRPAGQLILPASVDSCKGRRTRAFEAELKPAINPKDFLPEFHPQGNFMG
jgi:hypothetical protein